MHSFQKHLYVPQSWNVFIILGSCNKFHLGEGLAFMFVTRKFWDFTPLFSWRILQLKYLQVKENIMYRVWFTLIWELNNLCISQAHFRFWFSQRYLLFSFHSSIRLLMTTRSNLSVLSFWTWNNIDFLHRDLVS